MESVLVSLAVLSLLPIGLVGLLFCHELGHAIPVLLAGGRAHVTIGGHDGLTVEIGRLSVTVGPTGLRTLFTYGQVRSSDVDSTAVRAAEIIGGPVVSLTSIVVLGALLVRGVDGLLFWVLGNLLVSESYRAYQTIVPKTYSRGPYEGLDSDGKRFLQLLRSDPA